MDSFDIVIVGAGPAGLSAALYAARFCRSTLVLHNDDARASRIPKTYNAPGFADGVSGLDLIARMTQHAETFGALFVSATVTDAQSVGDGFELTTDNGGVWRARALILATGLFLNEIDLDHDVHEAAIANGVLRYCPVCDGYEHRGKRIAVVGCDISGAGEALFLRQFSPHVTLLPQHAAELSKSEIADLAAAHVRTEIRRIVSYRPGATDFQIYVDGVDDPYIFDIVYPALGVRPRSMLADRLGLTLTDGAKVAPGSIAGTDIDGLYCAGDLVEGLDQISVAMGHGAVAATKAHNWLRARDGHTVQAVLDIDDMTR